MDIRRSLFVASFGLVSFAPAFAQSTWYVDDGATPPGLGTFANPYASIQYAIDRPTTLSGDTLMVFGGTYAENIDFHGKTLSVNGSTGVPVSTIVGAPTAPTVRIASGEGAGTWISDFTITGGGGELVGGSVVGGGLFVDGASANVSNCTFEQCGSFVDSGGAIYARTSTVTVANCMVRQNQVAQDGGGAYFENSVVKILGGWWWLNTAGDSGGGWYCLGGTLWAGADVRDNVATNDGGAFVLDQCGATIESMYVVNNGALYGNGGGGALRGGMTTLRYAFFDGNVAHDGGDGGGLAANGAQLAVDHSEFTNNIADNDHMAGGFYGENSTGMFLRSKFDGNFADDGGGALVTGGALQFVECDFSNNTAQAFQGGSGSGGGLRGGTARRSVFRANHSISGASSSGQGGGAFGATLDHCTFVANTANVASGSRGAAFANCVVTNSIAWGNVPLASEVSGANTVAYSDTESNVAGVGNISSAPLFANQAGGDFHLLAGSPCIDAGDPTSALDPDGSLPDMGAFPFGQANCGAKLVYCQPKTNSLGCVPTIGFNAASPSVSGGQFVISAGNVLNQKFGLLFHGQGPYAAPFQGGTLCVAPALTRTSVQSSGGSVSGNDCTGTYSFQWTASYFASKGIGAGVDLFTQFWSRDPASPSGTGLTAAVQFVTCP